MTDVKSRDGRHALVLARVQGDETASAGHYMGLERNAPLVHDTLASWLDAHRL